MLIYTIRKVFFNNDSNILKRDAEIKPNNGQFAIYVILSAVLILLGGIFAGLTIGIMNQDEIYLQVLTTSGTATQSKQAQRILNMFKRRGKHLVLVTLLLCNVITNETLPIVLDRIAGGGVTAVVASSIFVIIFGEIIPQSLCVKFGLSIGAFFSPYVEGLGLLLYPISKPIALLLDFVLGEPHGNTYEKSGLKTLVSLHSDINTRNGLTNDEILIISSVLDLKQKSVADVMTPMDQVYCLSDKSILNEDLLTELKNLGHSRIPVYDSENPKNFKGMLLVKQLITYDPMDEVCISEFPLKTLPETLPTTSCLNMLNYFQMGKSHMCLISQTPGLEQGCVGVVTLEDIMEEMIGEEIQDETEPLLKTLNSGSLAEQTFIHNSKDSDSQFACESENINTSSADLKNYKSSYTILPNSKTVVDSNGHANSENSPDNIVHLSVPVDENDELHIHRKSKSLGDPNGISEEIITIHGLNKTVIVQDEYSQSYGSTSSEDSYISGDDHDHNGENGDLESQTTHRGRNKRRSSMTSIKSWFSSESKGRTRSRSRSKARPDHSKTKKKSSKHNGQFLNLKHNNETNETAHDTDSLNLKKVQPRKEPKFNEYLTKSFSEDNLDSVVSSQDKNDGVIANSIVSSPDKVASDAEENDVQVIKWGKDRKEED
ncbi:uncharacterized protein HGUI_01531 [Hanseniaspora guilliermondii]|uniref:Protein MAM3 n=1 Tax=Hanseniaspora guilliermondii TaxID=56406 RepID=A0A1L0B306_9ASCO|nr:uncharacterized protein HGUI_01531 [Hanseniaspora guilliermondii]